MITLEHNCTKVMILSLLKDPWTAVCAIGTFLSAASATIGAYINPVIAMIGGILGLVMLMLGIIEKGISIRKQLREDQEETTKRHPRKK